MQPWIAGSVAPEDYFIYIHARTPTHTWKLSYLDTLTILYVVQDNYLHPVWPRQAKELDNLFYRVKITCFSGEFLNTSLNANSFFKIKQRALIFLS